MGRHEEKASFDAAGAAAVGERPRDSVCIAILGSGGAGALTTGGLLLEAAARRGLYGMMTRSVGPQIRGGEAAAFVRLATRPVACMADRFDAVIAIDWRRADRFADELALDAESLLIGDPGKPGDAAAAPVPESLARSGARVVDIAFADLAAAVPGGRENMVALGLAAGLVGIAAEELDGLIAKRLGAKGTAAVEASRAGCAQGLAAAAVLPVRFPLPRPEAEPGPRWRITGNQAAGLGAVQGGVRFAAAYPITPATEVLEWLAPALRRLGGTLVQAEDELASINMIIGASFGGVPALTATSGPGLALMVESLGLAVASEVPIVVVDVMRGGPSTGIPTKSEQSDLNIAVMGCHGDAPHVVVAPLSVGDCRLTTQWAVHLAETLQTVAVVLSDQFLGQSQAVIAPPEPEDFGTRRKVLPRTVEGYRRYELVGDSISPMALPGITGGQYTADGLTHGENALPSSRASDHRAQLDKRAAKLVQADYGAHWAEIEGEGDIAILCWGSLAGAAREAAERLAEAGAPVRLVALRLLAPLRTEALVEALGHRRVLVVEQSHSGQFLNYLRGSGALTGETRSLRRPGPLPIRPGEIAAAVQEWRRS
ncbi:MAG: 2-oxoglutarate synthase [Alphaproteobacteria bacterium HGW-Alphaproteobacteria-2]|nr:MAG: 2-oxoglutarate synthase [Alphaproteobacteria bacterium HGW-Alphaproteobacteria-2]